MDWMIVERLWSKKLTLECTCRGITATDIEEIKLFALH